MEVAVVLGGSIAGLLAARVLADHAEYVYIIDRDGLEMRTQDTPRPGVPQGRQSHLVLPGGYHQLERWLPGFTAEITSAGGVLGEPDAYVNDVRQKRTGRVEILSVTRTLLENRICRRVLARPNVELLAGQVTGVEFQARAAVGVKYHTDGHDVSLPAGFVVDAMGRSSRLPDWLRQDGWTAPPLERLKNRINYASAYFDRRDLDPDFATASARYAPSGPATTFATVMPVEGPRWLVTLIGFGDHRPGHTVEDFRARCGDLPEVFTDAVGAGPIGEIDRFHLADSRRRRYGSATNYPAALVSLGDSVSSLNPVRGQGITSAALQASGLSEYLRTDPDLTVPARDFFALQTVVVDAAWERTVAAESAQTPGAVKVSLRQRVAGWKAGQVLAAAKVDPDLAELSGSVRSMTAHPDALATPAVLLRALRVNRIRGRTG